MSKAIAERANTGAVTLTGYANVCAALAEPRLSAGGRAGADEAHLVLRQAAAHALSAERIAAWQQDMGARAHQRAAQLPTGKTVDLVREFAEPWSLSLALAVTGASESEAAHHAELSRAVFLAAAHASDGEVTDDAKSAAAELARGLAGSAPASAIGVQAFIALSQTLPCFLAAAWLALVQHPDQLAQLRAQPALMPRAVDELLRFAGPSRAVFRRARSAVVIGDVKIAENQLVILMLAAANRDPAHFLDPDRLDFERETASVLAFGRGAHYCVGATLVRAAAATATGALIDLPVLFEPAGPPEWIDGFAIRAPATLPVVLRPMESDSGAAAHEAVSS